MSSSQEMLLTYVGTEQLFIIAAATPQCTNCQDFSKNRRSDFAGTDVPSLGF
jgi:hypothetical protein